MSAVAQGPTPGVPAAASRQIGSLSTSMDSMSVDGSDDDSTASFPNPRHLCVTQRQVGKPKASGKKKAKKGGQSQK